MSLPLPPRSTIQCNAPTAQRVHDLLTSVVAGHAQAATSYQFYEEVDTWLGPWGVRGYPIGYGKLYNVAFTTNAKLSANVTTRQWVWRTSIFLQEALRDYLVGRIRDRSFPSLTEPQLRQAAFESHAQAYDRGGLARVALVAPELIPVVATIPLAEFDPTSRNFGPTVLQVFTTLERVAPQVVGSGLAAMAGPAHTGVLGRAVRRDQRALFDQLAISRELGSIRNAINRGAMDHVPWLDRIIARLNARQFPNQGFAQLAGEVVRAAQTRRRRLIQNYTTLLGNSPEVRARFSRTFPGLVPRTGAQ